jgi:hypothetical protein
MLDPLDVEDIENWFDVIALRREDRISTDHVTVDLILTTGGDEGIQGPRASTVCTWYLVPGTTVTVVVIFYSLYDVTKPRNNGFQLGLARHRS